MQKELVRLSKFISYVLRHKPGSIGLAVDSHGWAKIDELVSCVRKHGRHLTHQLLQEIVAHSDKKRFSLSEDGEWIRASHGHTIAVDLELMPVEPPSVLYHGTAVRNVNSIKNMGLRPRRRLYVHLATDMETAAQVGGRRGLAIVLQIDSKRMYADGYEFFRAENGVWLTVRVPAEYICYRWIGTKC